MGETLGRVGAHWEAKKILHSRQLEISIWLGHSKQALIPDKSRGTALGKAVISKQGLIKQISRTIKITIT
jgi:hypothetical protein